MRVIAGRALKVAGWLAFAVVTGLVLALVLVPKIMGWVPLAVLTGSMDPAIPAGSEIVVDRMDSAADVAGIQIGDVISYLPNPKDPTLITHRVIGIGRTVDGTVTFTTRGDANGAADPKPVGAEQVRGVVLYHLPWIGRLTTGLTIGQKGVALTVVAVLLIGYAAWQVVQAVRDRRRRRNAPVDPPAGRTPHGGSRHRAGRPFAELVGARSGRTDHGPRHSAGP